MMNHPSFPEIVLPQLQRQELFVLFEEGLDLDAERLAAMLALPREALLADVLALLDHAVAAAPQYQARDAQEPLSVAELSFPAHALWLIAHLRGVEYFSEVTAFLAGDAGILDFWLGTALPQGLWQVIYHLGRMRLPALGNLIRETKSPLVRREVALTIGQIAWHAPLRREEIRDWIAEILGEIAQKPTASPADRSLAALLVVEVSQLRFAALLPKVEALYARKRIDASIAGQYADIVREVEGLVNSHAKAEVQYMPNFYAHARKTWAVYRDTPTAASDSSTILDLRPTRKPGGKPRQVLTSFDPRKKPRQRSARPGRNAPCFCGSGKKYKYCHGR